MQALYTAATGMSAMEKILEVSSHNIANSVTTSFKKFRANFQDLLYRNHERSGTITGEDGSIIPVGIQIGYGVKLGSTSRHMEQGGMTKTDSPLDLAIRGEGFFAIQHSNGETIYTRDGTFMRNNNGDLVTQDGYLVDPNINIPANALSVSISKNGVVEVITSGTSNATAIGTITLARFVNKGGLENVGDNYYRETASSGAPINGTAGGDGYGDIMQNFLEDSNVNSMIEISNLIKANRVYELNSKVVRVAEEMMSITNSLK